jgi:hypothetical protein
MNFYSAIFSVAAVVTLPVVAAAFPTVNYNPTTGKIFFINDSSVTLAHMTLLSSAGTITGDPLDISGTIVDRSERPFALTYLNVPPGQHDVGNIIVPFTPFFDLSGYFRYSLLGPPLDFGTPEPSSAILATLGSVALTYLTRACRHRR